MRNNGDPTNMQQLLEQIRESAAGAGRVSVNDILNGVGERSFGPVVLVAGLITLAPLIGDIPGVPTILGLVVLLTLGNCCSTDAPSGCRPGFPSVPCPRTSS